MSGYSGGGDSPNAFQQTLNQLPPRVSAPDPNDPDTQKKLEEERDAQRKSRGRASTILTGGQGLLDEPTTKKNVLLGY